MENDSPSVDLLFITHDRCDYTRLALPRLLGDPTERFRLTILDNASTDGTRAYLRDEVQDPRIVDVILSAENIGATGAMNRVWSDSTADLLGKCDNDCLVEPGWTRTLAAAHRDVERFGVLACWHYFEDDFDAARADHKIQSFGRHRIVRHPWTCGTGFLLKRSTFQRFGPIRTPALPAYWIAMARHGMINGFYFPLLLQEHMDDPKSAHSKLSDEAHFQAARASTFTLNHCGIHTLDERWAWRRQVLDELLDGPWQASAYGGWRRRARRALRKLSGAFGRSVSP